MSGFTAAGINTTTVTTTQQAPLGFELTVPDGDKGLQTWIYVQNKDSAELAVGTVCGRVGSSLTYQVLRCPTSETTSRVIGCVQTAIPAESYGFIRVLARTLDFRLATAPQDAQMRLVAL